MSNTAATQVTADPSETPYGKWMLHCVPNEGPNCAGCLAAKCPREGCEEGARLYAEMIDIRKGNAGAQGEETQDQ